MKLKIETFVKVVLLLIFSNTQLSVQDCAISVSSLNVDQPLILKRNTKGEHNEFYYPNDKDKITFFKGQHVDFACPGNQVMLGGNYTKSEVMPAKCQTGKFEIDRRSYEFRSIQCQKISRHSARYTGRKCLPQHREIEIGFVIRKRFLRQILVCFNQQDQITSYCEFNVSKTLAFSTATYNRSRWIQSLFYSLEGNKLNNLYKKKEQRVTINKSLGLKYTSQKYVSDKGNMYISRGHLAAKVDFLYGPQQRMTFYFINAAPQWQAVNLGNWLRLEIDVRKYANRKGVDLIVYTGTYGISTLPHEDTGKDIELYLYVNGTRKYIPVPRLFWKIIYDPKSESGVAFFTVNNPFLLDKAKDIICKSICYKYKWLTWKSERVELGYSYCCSIRDFKKVMPFPNVPNDLLFPAGGMSYNNGIYLHMLAVFFLKCNYY